MERERLADGLGESHSVHLQSTVGKEEDSDGTGTARCGKGSSKSGFSKTGLTEESPSRLEFYLLIYIAQVLELTAVAAQSPAYPLRQVLSESYAIHQKRSE